MNNKKPSLWERILNNKKLLIIILVILFLLLLSTLEFKKEKIIETVIEKPIEQLGGLNDEFMKNIKDSIDILSKFS